MSDSTTAIRVVTWNIHGCVGTDRRRDAERTGRVIESLAPDIAAFQEVDLRRQSLARPDTEAYLRALVGDHGHEAWALSGADGRYGQMLASRYPLTDRQVHDISAPGREPRRVMEATASLPRGPLRILATHLGLRPIERQGQFAHLRDIVLTDPTTPLLLMGDFNEWRSRILHRQLSDLFGQRTRHRSFPSRFPIFALDRILCRGGARLVGSRADCGARAASDHLPVIGEIMLSKRA